MSNAHRLSLLLAIPVLALGLFNPHQARAYYIRYDYYVNATDGAGPLLGEGVVYDQPELYGAHTVQGNPNATNRATAAYHADLPAGTLGSYAFAAGDVTDFWPFGFTATARVYQIYFTIRLDFTVAAGTYPAGVEVELSGRADGGLWSGIDAGATLQYAVDFGATNYTSPFLQIGIDADGSLAVHEPFDLVTRIVEPGSVLASAQVIPVVLSASIYDNWTWTVLSGAPPVYHTGAAEVDLSSGLRFTRISVPAGVTWGSEGGVFLRDVTAVEEAAAVPSAMHLEPNAPNPFNPRTTIRFGLPQPGAARLAVFDLAGRLIRTLVDESLPPGRHEVVWDGRDAAGRDVASGSYLARLVFDGRAETVRMGLVR